MGETKLFNSRFIFVLLYNAVTSIAYYIVTPILTRYVTSIGIELALAGTIAGAISITALVIRPFSGVIADNLNKKYVMIGATVLMGIALIGLGSVSTVPMLFFFRIMQGVGFALNGTCVYSMASQYMPKDKIGEGTGYIGLGTIISSSLGPTIGLELANRFRYQTSIILAGIIALIAAGAMLLFRYKPEQSENAAKRKLSDIHLNNLFAKELVVLALFAAAFSFSNGLVANFLSNICEEKSITGYSVYFTINALVMLASRPFAGKLTDKKGLKFVLIPSFIFAILAVMLIGWTSSLAVICAAAAFKALGQGTGQPAIQAECLKRLGPGRSGVATSTFYIGADFANGIAPAIGGVIASSFGYSMMFYISGIILLVALAGFVAMTFTQNGKAGNAIV